MLNLSINEPSSSSSSSSSISASSKTEPVTAQKEILVVEKPAPAPATTRVLPSSIKAANSNGEAKKNGQSSYSNGSSSPSEDKENNARIQTAAAQKNGEHHSVSGNSGNSSVENKPTVVFRSQPAQSNVSSTPAPAAHSHTPASVDNRKTKGRQKNWPNSLYINKLTSIKIKLWKSLKFSFDDILEFWRLYLEKFYHS